MVSNMWVTTDDNDGVVPRTFKVALVLLGLALLVTSVGWYVSLQPKFDEGRFDSCEVAGRPGGPILVLSFTYGDPRGPRRALDRCAGDGMGDQDSPYM